MTPLAAWIERQYRHSVHAMLESVSPTSLVKARPGFGRSVGARPGAVVGGPGGGGGAAGGAEFVDG